MIMEKEFVPYYLALRLKDLGFDEPCFGCYVFGDKLSIKYCEDQFISDSCCLAPTFSQAFRWFRNRHKLNCNVVIGETNFGFKIQYLSDFTNNWYEGYSAYEEAELACLDKLIEIVESKQKGDGK